MLISQSSMETASATCMVCSLATTAILIPEIEAAPLLRKECRLSTIATRVGLSALAYVVFEEFVEKTASNVCVLNESQLFNLGLHASKVQKTSTTLATLAIGLGVLSIKHAYNGIHAMVRERSINRAAIHAGIATLTSVGCYLITKNFCTIYS